MFQYVNLDKLLTDYPELHIWEYGESHTPRCIRGTFVMDANHNGVRFLKEYSIKIDLSGEESPSVRETGHHIDSNYPHRYTNGKLCLGTETDIIITCCHNNKFDLPLWFDEFVIPYFYSYEYYKRMGEYPFGERSHGKYGVLEYYMDTFNLESHNQAQNFLSFVNQHGKYRGHFFCPCGSGKRIRDCHKNEFIKALEPILKERIRIDLDSLKG